MTMRRTPSGSVVPRSSHSERKITFCGPLTFGRTSHRQPLRHELGVLYGGFISAFADTQPLHSRRQSRLPCLVHAGHFNRHIRVGTVQRGGRPAFMLEQSLHRCLQTRKRRGQVRWLTGSFRSLVGKPYQVAPLAGVACHLGRFHLKPWAPFVV